MDANEPLHAECAEALRRSRPPRVVSPFVLAEVDYLVGKRLGVAAQLAVIDEFTRGVYAVAPFGEADLTAARAVMLRYRTLRIGLADASIAVLAQRFDTLDVLTIDRRHFRTLRGPRGRRFRLLPEDA